MTEPDAGQGTSEYVGALAVVALIVAAVIAAGGVPSGVAVAMERQVCRITGSAGCPAETADAPERDARPEPDMAPERDGTRPTPRWQLAAAAIPLDREDPEDLEDPEDPDLPRTASGHVATWLIPPDGGPENDHWQTCDDGFLCLYGGDNYDHEVVRFSADELTEGLPLDENDRGITSFVNNTPHDVCGEEHGGFRYRGEVPLLGNTHSEGRNRDVHIDGRHINHIGTCNDAPVDPEPLSQEVGYAGGVCEPSAVCFFDDQDFATPICMVNLPDSVGGDDRFELPDDCRDRATSWVSSTDDDFCAVNNRRFRGDQETRLTTSQPWRDPDDPSVRSVSGQRRALPPGVDNTFDFVAPCT
jgi:hypothetical protein